MTYICVENNSNGARQIIVIKPLRKLGDNCKEKQETQNSEDGFDFITLKERVAICIFKQSMYYIDISSMLIQTQVEIDTDVCAYMYVYMCKYIYTTMDQKAQSMQKCT